jgi:hypothetical protein
MFGTRYSFKNISGIKEYQEIVPLSEYEDYLPFIELIKNGEKNILTKSSIIRFCLSSGTSSSTKLIPYNDRLKKEFQKAISVWLNNILRSFPSVMWGKSFWIISPVARSEINGKVPAGFENDTSYFGTLQKFLIRKVMVLPDIINKLSDGENYYYAVSYFLLIHYELRLLSVWNPLILINILKKIRQYHIKLISDIETGRIEFPEEISDSEKFRFAKYIIVSQGNAARLSQIFKNTDENTPLSCLTSNLWPKLELISCWTESWAGGFIPELAECFPGIPIQGKGLTATEAIITIPIMHKNQNEYLYLPCIRSHFMEFKRYGDQKLFLINQLEVGSRYEIIVTTGGGFYRYSLNDIVEVTGYYRNVPVLKFLGKSNIVCDITGEKLNEHHVAAVIERIGIEFNLKSSFKFISPLNKNSFPLYVFMVESIDEDIVIRDQHKIIFSLDQLLSENYHYKNSRKLIQLNLPRIYLMKPQALELYLKIKSANSIMGTVKICSLDFSEEWTNLLPGNFIN